MVIIAICVGLFAALYPAVQEVGNSKGPHGKIYPDTPPHENRRITHPTGVSIIAPENWDQIRDRGPTVPFLCVSCRGNPAARLRSWITIETCDAPIPTELPGFRPIQFNNYPAFELMKIEPTNKCQISFA